MISRRSFFAALGCLPFVRQSRAIESAEIAYWDRLWKDMLRVHNRFGWNMKQIGELSIQQVRAFSRSKP